VHSVSTRRNEFTTAIGAHTGLPREVASRAKRHGYAICLLMSQVQVRRDASIADLIWSPLREKFVDPFGDDHCASDSHSGIARLMIGKSFVPVET